MAAKVTKRQQAVLDCIEDCIREKGYGRRFARYAMPWGFPPLPPSMST